jgi:hypothetical protein
MLGQAASISALAAALAAAPQLPASAATAFAAEGAEKVAAAAAGCVAAISAIPSGKARALGEQQLGCGIVWGGLGHIVVPYAPLTRAVRQGTAGNPEVTVLCVWKLVKFFQLVGDHMRFWHHALLTTSATLTVY